MITQTAQLEDLLADQQTLIARAERLERLQKNADFKALINKNYMIDECAAFARASADPSLPADSRADALALAQAAGHLQRWFNVVFRMGEHARSQKADIEAALDEARAEEVNV
jgi:1,2-phenylacetyl-CoA epoxidase catalytic subunit